VAQQLTKIIADEVLLESAIAAARDSGTPYATNPCQFCTIVGTWHTQLRMVSPSPPRAREHRRYEIGQQPFWTPLRFPGQYYDAESDLFENWNIDTKPNIGRYLQPEPLLSTMSTSTKWRARDARRRLTPAWRERSALQAGPGRTLTRQYRRDVKGNETVRRLEARLRQELIDQCAKEVDKNLEQLSKQLGRQVPSATTESLST